MNNLVVDIEDKEVTKELEVLKQVSTKVVLTMFKKIEKDYENIMEKEKQEQEENLKQLEDSIEENNEDEKKEKNNTIVSRIVEINKKTIKSIKDKLLRE